MFDLDHSNSKVARSVRLDEREVDGIYSMDLPKQVTITHITKVGDDAVKIHELQQPATDEPMEGIESQAPDVEMNDPEPDQEPQLVLVFHYI